MSGATTKRAAIWKACQGVKSSVATMKTILVFTLMSLLCSFGASLSGHLSGYASTMRTRFRVDSRGRGSNGFRMERLRRPARPPSAFGFCRSTFAVLAPRRLEGSCAQSGSRPEPRLGRSPSLGLSSFRCWLPCLLEERRQRGLQRGVASICDGSHRSGGL